jgi:hypothetical protein
MLQQDITINSIKKIVIPTRARTIFADAKRILLLWNLRDNFEKNLSLYVETRNTFKNHVETIHSLVNNFVGSEPDEVPTKIKQTIKDLLEKGQKWVLKVGELYNLMAIWSIMITPTIQGSYSWYNLRRGEEVIREPWHQHVDIKVAQDVFRRLEQLKEAGVLAEKIGVVIDFNEIEATLKKLEPKNNLNLEGQVIYFPR